MAGLFVLLEEAVRIELVRIGVDFQIEVDSVYGDDGYRAGGDSNPFVAGSVLGRKFVLFDANLAQRKDGRVQPEGLVHGQLEVG